MLKFWELMGICQLDEDHMALQAMDQTPEVAWLVDVAEVAKVAHYEWLQEHRPDLLEASKEEPKSCPDPPHGL